MKDQQRIGLVLTSLPRYSETFFRNKIRGLQEQGIEVLLFIAKTNIQTNPQNQLECEVVISPNFKGSKFSLSITSSIALLKVMLLAPRVSYRHYRLDSRDGFSCLDRVKRLIQNGFLLRHNLDWLHFGFGMLAVGRENIAEAIGAKMAVSFRGFDLYLSPLKHPNCYDVLFKKEIRYHVLSKEMKGDLQQYGISSKKIQVITPAINVSFFQRVAKFKSQKEEVLKIITVARLHWKKGLEYTLQALALLKKQGVKFKYTIIGEGEDYERLVFAAYQLNIAENVCFLGKANQKEIKGHLNDSDIYLQYSIQEGFCNAVLEAQAMGLLCIVSNAEGLQENILHNETGWVVPKRQPELLAVQIQTVCNLPLNEKEYITKQASLRVKHNFDLLTQQRSFINFYNFKTNTDYSFI